MRRETITTSDGVRLSVLERGEGPPVCVCHGGPSTTYSYLVDDLTPLESEYALVFHDYRGSGSSDAADPSTYTFERLADDLDEIVSRLGFRSVAVLAHSMGGSVALQYALRHPGRCDRLVLIDTSPSARAGRMAWPTLRALGFPRTLKMLGRALRYMTLWAWRRESPDRTLARYSIMATMQEGSPAHRDEVQKREVLMENHNAPHLERAAFQVDLVDDLPRISQPVLVVYGTKDAPFAAGAQFLANGLPDRKVLAIEGAGHHPLVEAHDACLAAIRDFLQG